MNPKNPAQDYRRGSTRTNPSQPPPLGDSRITQWARAAGRRLEAGDFAQSLDGGQVEAELSSIFRETPEFGRSLAHRLADFHQGNSHGDLTLIGGGGEAEIRPGGAEEGRDIMRAIRSVAPTGAHFMMGYFPVAHATGLFHATPPGQSSLVENRLNHVPCGHAPSMKIM